MRHSASPLENTPPTACFVGLAVTALTGFLLVSGQALAQTANGGPVVIGHDEIAGPVTRETDCDAYASAYADRFLGSGDPTGDIVEDAMKGAVEGGAWGGHRGARKGALAGAAGAVMDNYANYEGGWQAMYDIGWELCISQQKPLAPQRMAPPRTSCRSNATVSKNPPGPYSTQKAPGCN